MPTVPDRPADPIALIRRYDLVTNYRCGSSIEEMELADFGDWVRYEDVEAELARLHAAHQELAGCEGNCSCAVFTSRHAAAMALYAKMDELKALQAAHARVQADRDEQEEARRKQTLEIADLHRVNEEWQRFRDYVARQIAALTQERNEYRTLAKIGTWHTDCRPNREIAARELAKSQAVIDKLADAVSVQTHRAEQAEASLAALHEAQRILIEKWREQADRGWEAASLSPDEILLYRLCAADLDAVRGRQASGIGRITEQDDPTRVDGVPGSPHGDLPRRAEG